MQCRGLHLEPSGSRAALSAVRRESLIAMHDSTSKSELRQALRKRRSAVSAELREKAAAALAGHLDPLPIAGAHIALYLPADGEIDTAELTKKARWGRAQLYLPVVGTDRRMQFARWEPDAALQVNTFGIPQPGPDAHLIAVSELDIVFMPLVGWDKSGARLGMGGGFYDRALEGVNGPLRVGLGFECQRVDQLYTDDWDVPMDFVATEAALYQCRQPS